MLQLAIDFSANHFEKYPDSRFASLSGSDGGGWCECEKCKAIGPTQTHRTFAFANAVAEALEDSYPNRGFCVLAYQATIEPPMDMKIHRNVVPFIEGYCGQAAADEVERAYDAVKNQLRNIPIADRPGVPYGHNNMSPRYLDPLLKACSKQINEAIRAAEREPHPRFRRRIGRDMGALKGELPEDLKGLLDE